VRRLPAGISTQAGRPQRTDGRQTCVEIGLLEVIKAATGQRLRVCIQQPSLAAYRVPLYRALARNPQFDIRVVHGEEPNLPNVAADGFAAEECLECNPRWLGGRLRWHSAQTRLAVRKQCDVLVLSSNLRYASLIPALVKARLSGVATVLWGHHRSQTGGGTADWLRRRVLFRLGDCVLCYSEHLAESIRSEISEPRKVFTAPNSVDQEPIRRAKEKWLAERERLAAFREEKGIGGGPNLLFVSRIKPRNKLDVLLKVLYNLRKQYPSATASIVGSANDERDRVERRCEELGLRESVIFPGAIYDEDQLAPWFLSADVFIYPALIGLSIFHAFGYGLPVIAGYSERRVNPEFAALSPDYNGFSFPDDDVEQATQSVLRVINDRGLRERLSRGAVQTVSEEFNMERMAANFTEAILFAARRRGLVEL